MTPKHKTCVDFDPAVWAYEDFSVDEDGHVNGSAYTHQFEGGYDVQIGVFSYDYERCGGTRTNHVPQVVVTDESGSIVAEPHANDSSHPDRAIQNAKGCAEYVFDSPEQFGIGD